MKLNPRLDLLMSPKSMYCSALSLSDHECPYKPILFLADNMNLEKLFENINNCVHGNTTSGNSSKATFTILRTIKEMNGNKFMWLQVTCNKRGRREQCCFVLY